MGAKHRKRAVIRGKQQDGTIQPLQDRRAFWRSVGQACDVWADCCKPLGHLGECQPPGEHAVLGDGPLPECRVVDYWTRKIACV